MNDINLLKILLSNFPINNIKLMPLFGEVMFSLSLVYRCERKVQGCGDSNGYGHTNGMELLYLVMYKC